MRDKEEYNIRGHLSKEKKTEMVKQPTRTLYVYLMARVIPGSLLTRPSRPLSHLISFFKNTHTHTTRANEREVYQTSQLIIFFFLAYFSFHFLMTRFVIPRCAWPFQFIFQLVPFKTLTPPCVHLACRNAKRG